jgi:hypothetical protein
MHKIVKLFNSTCHVIRFRSAKRNEGSKVENSILRGFLLWNLVNNARYNYDKRDQLVNLGT